MEKEIVVELPDHRLRGWLAPTRAGLALWNALPVTGQGNLWGKEIYFYLDFELPTEKLQEVVEKGALAYWPAGPALCLFFGPTPVSKGEECRAASPVEVVGRLEDVDKVKSLAAGLVVVARL